MAASAEKTLFIDVPYDRVFAMMITIMSNVGIKSYNCDPATKIFTATTGMSFSSYGEDLMIAVIPTVKGSSVRIRSECSMPTQVIDYGRNKKNIERFAQELGRLLGAPVYEG
jgi:hypothetical protein